MDATTAMATSAAGDPGAVELSELTTQALEAQICGLAARMAADECRWLELVGEFDRRHGYAKWECRSTSHWLSWHCGMSPRAGRERVRVARALQQFPLVKAEFATGQLSYSKVRAVTRVATSATEADLVELAQNATAAQCDRICSAYARTDRDGIDPDEPADVEADEQARADERATRQFVRTWHDDDGLVHLEAALSPEVGAQVEAALASALEHLDREPTSHSDGQPDGPAEPPEPRLRPPLIERQVGAMERIARAYLSLQPVPPSVERRHLVVLVDAGVLTRQAELGIDGTGRCTLNGQRLTPEAARALGASAALTTVLLDHRGLPLSVGRRSREPTPAQRLALHVRDRGMCRFPGCHHDRVDAHHVVSWEHGGPTDLDSLVLLCPYHHQLLHRAGLRLEFDPVANEVRVFRPDGSELTALEPDVELGAADQTDAVEAPPAGEEGTRLDLKLIVGNLAWLDDRARRGQGGGGQRRRAA
jgi:hypothetical protein